MPTGGTTGQVLVKASAADFDTQWVTPSGGGGGGGGASLEVGDTLVTARTLAAPAWLLCNGAAYLRTSYPDLWPLMAAVPTAPALDWSTVTSGFGTTGILGIATDGAGVWVAGGDNGVMTRSTNNGATWSAVTSGFGSTAIRGIATDGAGVWVAVGDSGVMARSVDVITEFFTPNAPQPAPLKRYIYTGAAA